jgi:hypothetical protein
MIRQRPPPVHLPAETANPDEFKDGLECEYLKELPERRPRAETATFICSVR